MTKKKATTPTTAEGGEVTAERLRAFLAHPDVKENVKVRVRNLVGELYEAGEWDTLPEEPEMYMLEFRQTYINDHLARGTAEPDEREIYEKLAAVINRHEPKDARTVRRPRSSSGQSTTSPTRRARATCTPRFSRRSRAC
jgi:hypothetical protein